MPGIVVFRRRWAVGSDDLIVPALFLIVFHLLWVIVIGVTLIYQGAPPYHNQTLYNHSTLNDNMKEISNVLIGFTIDWILAFSVEIFIVIVSLKGSILNDAPRKSAELLLYSKLDPTYIGFAREGSNAYYLTELSNTFYIIQMVFSANQRLPQNSFLGLWIIEIGLTTYSIWWLLLNRNPCKQLLKFRNVILGLVISNSIIFVTAMMTIWCSWDQGGRSWVKLKRYQKSLKDQQQHHSSKLHYRHSGAPRNWRQRKVRQAYENSWDHRCHLLFCCVKTSKAQNRTSFADIARLLSEFFRDLDVVPSDVVVGLMLLRKRQQLLRLRAIRQVNNPVYLCLSGVRITPSTLFLNKTNDRDVSLLRDITHYMHFAVGMYGWPMYVRKKTSLAVCRLCSQLSCLNVEDDSQTRQLKRADSVIDGDNCCGCNLAAYSQMCGQGFISTTQIVFVTYHVDVGETPFLVAIDFKKKTIVITIRGTLSLKDVLTDLNADGEPLLCGVMEEEWIGHKGMVCSATYVYKKLKGDDILTKAFNWTAESHSYPIVCVGHSLGAGTAVILSIMLKREYPDTKCYAYSPPGGLLSKAAMEYSKEFVISCVVGKDVVPRVGLHQLEALRHDLIYAIHKSNEPKYKTLASSLYCCGGGNEDWTSTDIEAQLSPTSPTSLQLQNGSSLNSHPLDSSINLSVHQPLYPPGNIVHLVRYHPGKISANQSMEEQPDTKYKKDNFTYKAIWADNTEFNEVLISKRMVEDHMPDNVMEALLKFMNQSEEEEKAADQVLTSFTDREMTVNCDSETTFFLKTPEKKKEATRKRTGVHFTDEDNISFYVDCQC